MDDPAFHPAQTAAADRPVTSPRWWAVVIPNALTVARLLAALAFPLIPASWWLGWVVFGTFSDSIDGMLTRWWQSTTRFGQWLDPIADKAFVLSVLGTLWFSGTLTSVELATVLARDVIVLGLSVWVMVQFREHAVELKPRWSGKFATAAQFLFLLAVLCDTPAAPAGRWAQWWGQQRNTLWLITAATSLVAAIDYLAMARYHWHRVQRLEDSA